MKGDGASVTEEHLYLEFSHRSEEGIFPLHTSISLFLLSYCDCKIFKIFLVPTGGSTDAPVGNPGLVGDLEIQIVPRRELPLAVGNCRLPAVAEGAGNLCRAGLSVVLRHVIEKAFAADPSRKDVLELLGFKKTCLKACAEVSQWTRLCELSIPVAVERFLRRPGEDAAPIPPEIQQLERKLGEPVRVHNDDKVRRLKLKQQKAVEGSRGPPSANLELEVALSKLALREVPAPTDGEPSHVGKVKSAALPPLDHVFAEGLYFTLADLVLLPCIHPFWVLARKKQSKFLDELPLIASWYRRVQEVPGVKKAAQNCGIQFLQFPQLGTSTEEQLPKSGALFEAEPVPSDPRFVGGPRPTMSKLMERGIEAKFSPHPCPNWTLDWSSLPAAVSPEEGKMSGDRALRKQQQLNNLVSMVTRLAKPGDTIVDFCSGGGHVGIVLAYLLPSCQVILIENKELSLVRAKSRSDEIGLTNIWFIQANLDYFTGRFNIGVALHACGVATDMVIERCIQVRAAFVTCPCCYGFIQNTVKFTFPRSQQFKEVLSYKEHMILCRFADQTAVQLPLERRLIGKHCMGLVDLDRARAAEGHGYSVQVISMEPESCSPKNNMIVGLPI
ncbi:glutathione S-transferase C-terminal domain-containing protein isoform X2 [Ornithorhynchus anatinus]|nr:glutathione S-transferase C-terminal domain-containing protein isoform X2 [Ornithorhynchus anatinus]XP_028932917.1 glutathione S-transferase C-terminal domain-containing protein isoform X2 [Ornithorhynchus anatinus]XP_028932918.1 glutathione S-transferase C-terminal domain-containing protein isoform X2 [Ornithorhynchus anatinus]